MVVYRFALLLFLSLVPLVNANFYSASRNAPDHEERIPNGSLAGSVPIKFVVPFSSSASVTFKVRLHNSAYSKYDPNEIVSSGWSEWDNITIGVGGIYETAYGASYPSFNGSMNTWTVYDQLQIYADGNMVFQTSPTISLSEGPNYSVWMAAGLTVTAAKGSIEGTTYLRDARASGTDYDTSITDAHTLVDPSIPGGDTNVMSNTANNFTRATTNIVTQGEVTTTNFTFSSGTETGKPADKSDVYEAVKKALNDSSSDALLDVTDQGIFGMETPDTDFSASLENIEDSIAAMTSPSFSSLTLPSGIGTQYVYSQTVTIPGLAPIDMDLDFTPWTSHILIFRALILAFVSIGAWFAWITIVRQGVA